jgi:hypothetical protein
LANLLCRCDHRVFHTLRRRRAGDSLFPCPPRLPCQGTPPIIGRLDQVGLKMMDQRLPCAAGPRIADVIPQGHARDKLLARPEVAEPAAEFGGWRKRSGAFRSPARASGCPASPPSERSITSRPEASTSLTGVRPRVPRQLDVTSNACGGAPWRPPRARRGTLRRH